MKEIDLLSFQVQELNDADVKLGEEEALEAERTSLMSFEKIFSLLNEAKMLLSGNENFDGGVEVVDSACSNIQKAAEYNPEYESQGLC